MRMNERTEGWSLRGGATVDAAHPARVNPTVNDFLDGYRASGGDGFSAIPLSVAVLCIPSWYERFMANVIPEPNSGCWLWIGNSVYTAGYGAFSIKHRQISAHRASYLAHFGGIPEGAYILHKCDNKPCVNPRHLYAGSASDNTRDTVARGQHYSMNRGKTHCKRGHKLSAPNLARSSVGARICKECAYARHRAWLARKMAGVAP